MPRISYGDKEIVYKRERERERERETERERERQRERERERERGTILPNIYLTYVRIYIPQGS